MGTDASSLVRYLDHLASDPQLLLASTPEELPKTLTQEQAWLDSLDEDRGCVVWLACDGAQIIGMLDFSAGGKTRTAHAGEFGMCVLQDWRADGVGTALLTTLADWAEAHPLIERVGLRVLASNEPAIRLYERLGWNVEGRLRNAIRWEETRVDPVLMGRLF